MSKAKKRAYADTTVAVSKSRVQIDTILMHWGVVGIQWEDRISEGVAQLRFRWLREDGSELVARFRIEVDNEEALKERSADHRTGKFSEKKYERELLNRGKREHRILMNLLKNVFEAIEEGIMPAEALLLPWIEDVEGNTVYDKLAPRLGALATMPIHKALMSGE